MKNKIILLKPKRKHEAPVEVGGALEIPKRARYEHVANGNVDKLKKMLRDLQIEASGGSLKQKKTFTL